MTELIAQNYNHPAICFWGISNEIIENKALIGVHPVSADPEGHRDLVYRLPVLGEGETGRVEVRILHPLPQMGIFPAQGKGGMVLGLGLPDTHVYPQQADFTFFGGLYRNVTFVEVEKAHFDLMKRGTRGVLI